MFVSRSYVTSFLAIEITARRESLSYVTSFLPIEITVWTIPNTQAKRGRLHEDCFNITKTNFEDRFGEFFLIQNFHILGVGIGLSKSWNNLFHQREGRQATLAPLRTPFALIHPAPPPPHPTSCAYKTPRPLDE